MHCALTVYRLFMKEAEHGDLHSLLDKQTDHLLTLKGLCDRNGDPIPRKCVQSVSIGMDGVRC